jgi:hypothetical protein
LLSIAKCCGKRHDNKYKLPMGGKDET